MVHEAMETYSWQGAFISERQEERVQVHYTPHQKWEKGRGRIGASIYDVRKEGEEGVSKNTSNLRTNST